MTDRELMQQAFDAMSYGNTDERETARIALRERLAQPEQEPVANIRIWHKNEEQHAELWNWDKGIETLPDGYYDLYTAPLQRKPLTDERIESVRHMRDVQGYDGNWNYDPYMQGLYNGLEFALSLLEVRQPEFKDAPATWLGDIKFKRDKLSSEAAHGIKENT